ncbi:MAG TPA: TonB-dependent receptor [bacterium]|nr:TonB-dependent receptor [bacterium]
MKLSTPPILLLIICLLVFPFTAIAEEDDSEDETPTPGAPTIVGEELVVTGTRVEEDPQNIPADVSVIDQHRLQRPGVKSSLDALTDIAGVKANPRQDHAIFNDIEVRGLAANATSGGNLLIILDGIPQRRLSFGGPYLGGLPYDAVYRLEMVKGPLSSLYGRNALAGALQLFTDPGAIEPHCMFNTAFEYPTISTRAAVQGSGPVGRLPFATFSLTGSFTKAEGWQERNRSTRGDLYLHVNVTPTPNDQLKILAGYFSAAEESVAPVLIDEDGERLDDIDRDMNLAVPGQNALDLTEFRAASIWTHHFGDIVRSKFSGGYWHGDTIWAVGRPSDRPAEGTILSRSSSDRENFEDVYFTELELTGFYRAGNWLSGSLSIGGSYEFLTYRMTKVDITTDANVTADGINFAPGIPLDLSNPVEPGRSTWVLGDKTTRDTEETDTGLFVRDQTTLFERVHLSGGVRYDAFDRTQVDPATEDEAQHDDSAVSPSAGLSVAILNGEANRLNLYGAWGMGFSPIFRAVNNTKFADVDPETSRSVEGGVKTELLDRRLNLTVAAYQLERLDIVAMNPDTNLQENVGDWKIFGIETQLSAQPIPQLLLYANHAWRDPLIDRYEANTDYEDNDIPAIARQTAVAGAEGQASFGLFGGVEGRYVSLRYGNEANSFELPAYTLLDAHAGYRWSALRFAVFAKNLLDQEYYSAVFNGVVNGSAFEGAPRTVGLQVRGDF